jgi:hypothetical protein
MALTHPGCAVRVRLPRWDSQVVERLERAGIGVTDAPGGYVPTSVEVALVVDAERGEAVDRVCGALRGWTVLLPFDFAA